MPAIQKTRSGKLEAAKEVQGFRPAKWNLDRFIKWLKYHKFQKVARLPEKEKRECLQTPFKVCPPEIPCFYGGIPDGKTSKKSLPVYREVEEDQMEVDND